MTTPLASRLRLYRLWRTAALLCGVGAAEFGVLYWQQAQRFQQPSYADSADVDTQLLTDELPVTAYLDRGFEIWLYHETPAAQQ